MGDNFTLLRDTMRNRVPLVIEVVSTNWPDDYAQNRWYEAIGIALRVRDRWHEGKRHSPQWGEL